MKRALLVLAVAMLAAAQELPSDPLQTAIRAARILGATQFEQAASTREKAREVLRQWPATSDDFPSLVNQVARLYANAGWNAESRAVVEEGLAQTKSLGKTHPTRIALLNWLASSWQDDGNLLKSQAYLEEVVEAMPPDGGPEAMVTYIRLATFYRALGRMELLGEVEDKIRSLGATNPDALAAYYEESGDPDKASAVYRKLAEDAAEPLAMSQAWQNVARIAAGQQHFAAAAAATEQAIAAQRQVEEHEGPDPTLQIQLALAGHLQSAGSTDPAERLYQQLLTESRPQEQSPLLLYNYATFLAQTKRGAQGESILQDYLASHADLDEAEKNFVLGGLAEIAALAGDSEASEKYAQATGPEPDTESGESPIVLRLLADAGNAANQGRLADAHRLAADAIDRSTLDGEWSQISTDIPEIASVLAAKKESARAEQLYQRLFGMAETWRVNTVVPLLAVSEGYVTFLMNQPDRLGEVSAAIEQCRRLLIEANGPDSATLVTPVRMKIEFARLHPQWMDRETAMREVLALEETLSGASSKAYKDDAKELENVRSRRGQ